MKSRLVEEKEKASQVLNFNNLARLSAVRKGLEPSTSGVTGRHSNQLNYRTLRISALTVSGCFPNADAKIGIFPLLANFFYLISMIFFACGTSCFSTFGMLTLRTPLTTEALIFSLSTSSGRTMVCWNFE